MTAEYKCRIIRELEHKYCVEKMCRELNVSRASYYRYKVGYIPVRSSRDLEMGSKITAIYEANNKRYGSPRIRAELSRIGIHTSKRRVERIMDQLNIHALQKKRHNSTTDSKHSLSVAPNLLNRNFTAAHPNEKWVADTTYIRTTCGWIYLAAVVDLHSRKVIGWAMGNENTKGLVIKALNMAITRRKPRNGLICHSDRGSQYASHEYQEILWENGIRASMSREGNCWDNAVMESFFHSLKVELLYGNRYFARIKTEQLIFEYIEIYYNRYRLHSALGYKSPEEYEKQSLVA